MKQTLFTQVKYGTKVSTGALVSVRGCNVCFSWFAISHSRSKISYGSQRSLAWNNPQFALHSLIYTDCLFHSKYTIPPTPHEGHDISKCMLQMSLKFSNVEVQVHITYYYLDRSDRKWVWERDWEWDQECRSDSDMVGMLPLALRLPQYFCKDFSIFHVTMCCSSQVRKKNLRRS